MGQRYRQFSVEERCAIARLQAEGRSIQQIAAALDRAPSSVARELKRNTARTTGYSSADADKKAKARRWSGSRLDRDEALRNAVLEQLRQGWSPEQIVGRARRAGKTLVGVEAIYRFIYAQIARHNDFTWRRYLPRAKFKRGRRASRGGSPALYMSQRIPLNQRPAEADNRKAPGHWEADLMAFARYGQNVLMLHERTSRALIGVRLASKQAGPVASAIRDALLALPVALRKTLTFDNGTEFTRHYELNAIGTATYFCEPMRHGRKAASRTPSDACAASCRARPISLPSMTTTSSPSSRPTTIPRENALTGRAQPRPSQVFCCTSNENPPSRLAPG